MTLTKLLLIFFGVLAAFVGFWVAVSTTVKPAEAGAVPFGEDVLHANRLAGEWLVARSFPLPACGEAGLEQEGRPAVDRQVEAGKLDTYKVAPVEGPVGEMYSWKDASGATHYSDDLNSVPEAKRAAAKVDSLPKLEVYRGEYTRLKLATLANVQPQAPRQAAGATGRVTAIVYSAVWCGACKSTKAFLSQQGVVVDERDIDQDPKALAELVSLAGKEAAIPVTVIGKRVIGGYDPPALTEAIRLAQ